ncbi:MAG: hypothetical protein MJZ81_07785 [Bacteroidales bacterium]|nr:hypothetical protein [Bacteroidales bacterium]
MDERARTYTNINKNKIKEKEINKINKNNNACAGADAQETTGTKYESAADMMRRWNELTGRKDGEE